MENKHIDSISITNFKGFKDTFELNDAGKFNVIAGPNNVGKTSVLEALCFDENPEQMTKNMLAILKMKDFPDEFGLLHIDYFQNIISNDNHVILNIHFLNGNNCTIEMKTEIKDWTISVKCGDNEKTVKNLGERNLAKVKSDDSIPLIYANAYYQNIAKLYSNTLEKDSKLEKQFIESVSTIFKIHNIRLFYGNLLGIQRKEEEGFISLAQFGEGEIKIIRTVLEIMNNRNSRLMIDEIDTGIHFTNLEKYLNLIIELSEEYNVQIFASTHSEECLFTFKDIFSKKDEVIQQKAVFYRMRPLNNGNPKAYRIEFKNFEHQLEYDNELR